jgi:hypothetical protein
MAPLLVFLRGSLGLFLVSGVVTASHGQTTLSETQLNHGIHSNQNRFVCNFGGFRLAYLV